MQVWATKDLHDREEDEAERLVRPSPKVKPPRHDRRREDTQPDRDPDVDSDTDTKRDPDLSLNRKNVGGSVRVLSRHLGYDPLSLSVARRFADLHRADEGGDEGWVAVVNKETGEPTRVKKETLQGESGAKYEVVKDEAPKGEEKSEGPEEKPEAGGEKSKSGPDSLAPEHRKELEFVQGIIEKTKKDPTFQKALSTLTGLPEDTPLSEVKGLEGSPELAKFKTVGEAVKWSKSIPDWITDHIDAVEEAEKAGKPPPKPVPPKPAEAEKPSAEAEKASGSSGEQLHQLAETNPNVKGMIDILSNPKNVQHSVLTSPALADRALSELGGLKDVKFPEGVKTLGDFRKALAEAAAAPKKEKPKKAPTKEAPATEKPGEEPGPGAASPADLAKTVKDEVTKALGEQVGKAVAEQVGKAVSEAMGAILKKHFPAGVPGVEGEKPAKKPKGKGKGKPAGPETIKGQRKPATPQEVAESRTAIKDTFPPEMAYFLLNKNLHPKDVGKLVSDFRLAREHDVDPENVSEFAARVSQNFHLDPAKVPVPELIKKNGKMVPFDSLTPEEQGVAMDDHRMSTVAMSLASREQVAKSLSSRGAPRALAEKIAETMLSGSDSSPEERLEQAKGVARNIFVNQITGGAPSEPISDDDVRSVLKTLSKDPASQKLATAYFQAADYQKAREEFLDSEAISERQDPKDMARGLAKANAFFEGRAKLYPSGAGDLDTGKLFRHRVLEKLKVLAPQKYPLVRDQMVGYEAKEFETAKKKYESDQAKFVQTVEKAQGAVQKELEKEKRKYDKDEAYRTPDAPLSYQERVQKHLSDKGVIPPREPVEPPWYGWWKTTQGSKNPGKGMWEKFMSRMKTASGRVAIRWQLRHAGMPGVVLYRWGVSKYSSYPSGWTMGNPSDKGVATSQGRQAVYWGVAPYPKGNEGFAPYPDWQQAHARDLGDADYNGILTAAREWMKTPVLATAVDGIVRDTQLRAALDLALRVHHEGKYAVGLHPTVYNDLLGRLGGVSGGSGSLLTIREASSKSTYGVAPGEVCTMKPSAQLTAIAARLAATNPEVAFDLVELSTKLAGEVPPQFLEHMKGKDDKKDDKKDDEEGQKKEASYQSLRALVIRTAAQHPEAREAFLPVLQALKNG